MGGMKRPIEITCEHCGMAFRAIQRSSGHSRGPRRFCSRRCGALARPPVYGPPVPRVERHEILCDIPWRECGWCGRTFIGRHGRTTCSADCAILRRRKVQLVWSHENRPGPDRSEIVFRSCGLCGRTVVRRPHHEWNDRCRSCKKALERATERPKSAAHRRPYLLERDRQICQLCGGKTLPEWAYLPGTMVPHPKAPTVDHIVPASQGGSHDDSNLQLAHFECNWRKADRVTNEQLLLV